MKWISTKLSPRINTHVNSSAYAPNSTAPRKGIMLRLRQAGLPVNSGFQQIRNCDVTSTRALNLMKPLLALPQLVAVLSIAGCATALEINAEKLRMIPADQKSACESLGVVTADQQLGPYKARNAMNQVLNEAARRGSNAIYLVSQGQSGIDGASVTAEALRCK
jgi:hypothetical protein